MHSELHVCLLERNLFILIQQISRKTFTSVNLQTQKSFVNSSRKKWKKVGGKTGEGLRMGSVSVEGKSCKFLAGAAGVAGAAGAEQKSGIVPSFSPQLWMSFKTPDVSRLTRLPTF
jgi:hypothetical protein